MKKALVRTAIVAGVILALLTVAVFAAWAITGFGSAASMANHQYSEWKKNGLPVTRDEVVLTPLVAEHENALYDIQRAVAFLNSLPRKPGSSPNFSDPEVYINGTAKAYVEDRREALELAYAAAEKPSIRFDRDWDQGWNLLFPEFAKCKDLARCLAIDAEFKAAEGDWKTAARNIYTGRRLAAFAAGDSTLISKLVGIAIDAIILEAAGTIASRSADNPAALAALRKALEDSRWDIDRESALRGEAYMSLAVYRSFSNEDIIAQANGRYFYDDHGPDYLPTPPPPVRDGQPRAILSRAVNAEVMAFWNEFYPRLKNPKEDLTKLGADMEARRVAYETSGSIPKKAAGTMLPIYGQAFTAFAKRHSEERTAIAFIGILQYRNRHGAWPATLKAAGVDEIDAIDGKPLRYVRSGSSARVYNVGQNGSDDGGISSREAKAKGLRSTNIDNAFIHPWPKRVK